MDREFSLEQDAVCWADAPEETLGLIGSALTEPATAPNDPERRFAQSLSALEQTVVALAVFDDRRTVEPLGPLGRLAARLFGFSRSTKLADARLEALRRYAVLARVDGVGLSETERDAFLAAGFSKHAAAAVQRLTARVQRPR